MADITITVGTAVGTKTFADNAMVVKTLLRYFEMRGLAGTDDPDTLTNDQKLDSVVAEIARDIIREVRNQELQGRRQIALVGLEDAVDAEYDFDE